MADLLAQQRRSSCEAFRSFVDLKDVDLNSAILKRTPANMMARSWMANFFDTVGDKVPNRDEIHLEKMDIKSIWAAMLTELDVLGWDGGKVSYGSFLRLWKSQFPHVKVRKYKAVTGKCQHCAILTELRTSSKKATVRRRVTSLHALHRYTYMNERKVYYDKINAAISSPHSSMSIIIDGMAQQHSELPYLANLKKFPSQLPMKLTGCLEHGQRFVLYRTFGNVEENANLAIHCILMQLEDRIQRLGTLPPTINIQIDGGSENANKTLLALCELIVAMRLTQKIYLTRLPVGHTHEDIDGKFGRLWTFMRNKLVLSPQLHSQYLQQCFGGEGRLPFSCIDVFCVADYKSLLKPWIDTSFSTFAKEDDTQLAWKFEAVPRSDQFPIGVKTSYKAYASDAFVYEFKFSSVEDADIPEVPLKVQKLFCEWQPKQEGQRELGVRHDGLFILRSFPLGPIVPDDFKAGHRKVFDDCMRVLAEPKWLGYSTSGNSSRQMISDWNTFASTYPETDSVGHHVSNCKPHWIPLKNKLFNYIKVYVANAQTYSADLLNVEVPQESGDVHSTTIAAMAGASVDIEAGIPLDHAISLPSVSSSTTVGTRYIPPRLVMTVAEHNALQQRSSTIHELLQQQLLQPKTLAEYQHMKKEEIIARLKEMKVTSTRFAQKRKEELIAILQQHLQQRLNTQA